MIKLIILSILAVTVVNVNGQGKLVCSGKRIILFNEIINYGPRQINRRLFGTII